MKLRYNGLILGGLRGQEGVDGVPCVLGGPVAGWFCYWVLLCVSKKKKTGGSEELTGVDVLSTGSPGVVDGYRMVKGVESTSSWRSFGSSV
jgi:hypothetical protein